MIAKYIKENGYPDFMEKFGKKSRVSQGVIGQLYRSVKNTQEAAVSCLIEKDYEKSMR